MLARAAENLYWMARYLERAENTARLINSTTHVLLDLPLGASFGWVNLLEIVGLDDLFHQHYSQADEEAIMRFLIEDTRNPSSILSCVQYARENTRTLREVLPAEIWERTNGMYLYIKENATIACRSRRNRYMVLDNIIEQRHAIIGLISGTMGRDLPYQLVKLGRNLERADMTTRILDISSAVSFPQDSVLQEALFERIWMSTLNSLSAYQSYRRMVNMHVRRNDVVNFLLCDERLPRSIVHCLAEMESCFKFMPQSQQFQMNTAELAHRIRQGHAERLDATALHEYLDWLQTEFGKINDALTQRYFHAYDNGEPPLVPNQAEIEFAEQ